MTLTAGRVTQDDPEFFKDMILIRYFLTPKLKAAKLRTIAARNVPNYYKVVVNILKMHV